MLSSIYKSYFKMFPVLIDGKFVGFVPRQQAPYVERQLRFLKVSNDMRVPFCTEIILVRNSTDPVNILTQYPGLYIFTEPARFIRPVTYLPSNRTEFIGKDYLLYLFLFHFHSFFVICRIILTFPFRCLWVLKNGIREREEGGGGGQLGKMFDEEPSLLAQAGRRVLMCNQLTD